MAGASQQTEEGVFSGINVTPLVDITLVLLIVFMVTAKLITSNTLQMDLPRAAMGAEQQVVFSVAVAQSGETTIDAEKMGSDAAIVEKAKAARASHPELRAVIQADEAVPHGRVVRVMDLLKQGGIGKIAFGVTPTPSEASNPDKTTQDKK